MKNLIVVLVSAMISLTIGCDKGGTAGGPGATDKSAKPPIYGEANNTFNLMTDSISVKQGEVSPGTIGIKRGTNFDQDVKLLFEDLPKGIAIDPTSGIIKSASTEAKFTVTASDDAAIGEFTVKVVGHPAKGGDATNQFKLSVGKKDSFTLSMPFWTTGLKQGEAKSVSISISRDKKFDQDVSLKFEGLSNGVSVEPSTGVIKNGESEAKFVLKASNDAALGDFAVMVIGHPTKGADASHEFKFTVAKK